MRDKEKMKTFSVRFSSGELELIEAQAKDEGRPVANLIRRAVECYLRDNRGAGDENTDGH